MNTARDGTTSPAAADAYRAEARALAAAVQTWGTNGSELPTADEATTAMHRLNSYGEGLRDAVSGVRDRQPTASGSSRSAQPILGEASRRLGGPPLGGTAEAVVRRAQNLARLVHGLLRALDAEADTALRHHEPPAPKPHIPRTRH